MFYGKKKFLKIKGLKKLTIKSKEIESKYRQWENKGSNITRKLLQGSKCQIRQSLTHYN